MKLTEDTASKVALLEECLYSTHNRVEIARFLVKHNRDDLLATALEDLYCGVQLILDEYCVVRNDSDAHR